MFSSRNRTNLETFFGRFGATDNEEFFRLTLPKTFLW